MIDANADGAVPGLKAVDSKKIKIQVIFPVVLWLHSHLSSFLDLIATVGHCQSRGFDSSVGRALHRLWVRIPFKAPPPPPPPKKKFQIIFPVVLWLHSHLSSFLQVVWVSTLAGLCSWTSHFTLTVPLSTQVYKWVPAN